MSSDTVNIRRYQIPGMTNDDNIDFYGPRIDVDNRNSPQIVQDVISDYIKPKTQLNYPRKVQVIQAEILDAEAATFHGMATEYLSSELGINAQYLSVTAHDDLIDSDIEIPDSSVDIGSMTASQKTNTILLRGRRFFKRVDGEDKVPPIGSWIEIDYADRANKRTGIIVKTPSDGGEVGPPAEVSSAGTSGTTAHTSSGASPRPLGAVNGTLAAPVAANPSICPDNEAEYSRLQSLADTVGIELAVLLAIRQVESGGSSNAVRFEPHWFLKKGSGARADLSGVVPYIPGPNHSVVDYHRSHTNRSAFENAYAYDPMQAIYSVSWGLYQVMGLNCPNCPSPRVAGALDSPEGAQEFIDYFNEDPVAVSDELLIAWMLDNPSAVRHANNLDWTNFAKNYNGGLCCAPHKNPGYDVRLQQAYSQALQCEGYALESSPDDYDPYATSEA